MNNKFIQQIKCWFTFLFIICSTFSAWGAYAQTAKVTLQMDNVRMEQVMNEIEKQTSYFFIVNKGVDINRTISINVADKLAPGLYRYFGTYKSATEYGGTEISKLIIIDDYKHATK